MTCVKCGQPGELRQCGYVLCAVHRKHIYSRTCACGTKYGDQKLSQIKCKKCGQVGLTQAPSRIEEPGPGERVIESQPGTRIRTIEQLLETCEIDLSKWEVLKPTVNKWDVASKDPEGNVTVTELFQVRAILGQKSTFHEDTKAEILADIAKHAFKYPPITRSRPLNKSLRHMLEIGIYDLHLGKLSWNEESGEDYDLKIASQVFRSAVSEIISKAAGYPIEKILYPVGNDLFHIDSQENKTTRGTQMHADGRYPKIFRRGRELMVWAVDELSKIAPVEVVIVPGNHDEQTAFSLGEVLSAWYRNSPEVTIDNRPKLRKYARYGKNLIGLTHGVHEKISALPMIMAAEVPLDWAETTVREMHIGHWHSRKRINALEEYNGVVVRVLPPLTATDAWHANKGYVCNLRAAESYLWAHNGGLSAMLCANILPEVA